MIIYYRISVCESNIPKCLLALLVTFPCSSFVPSLRAGLTDVMSCLVKCSSINISFQSEQGC